MELSPELVTALTGVAIAAAGALGVLIRYIVVRLEAKIKENTAITVQARDAAENGHAIREALIAERDQARGALAKARDALTTMQISRDTYRDIVRYVNSRPDGRSILLTYQERRQVAVNDQATDALIAAIAPLPAPAVDAAPPPPPPRRASDYVDDPTGTDAGAHPGGRS